MARSITFFVQYPVGHAPEKSRLMNNLHSALSRVDADWSPLPVDGTSIVKLEDGRKTTELAGDELRVAMTRWRAENPNR